MKIDAQVQYNSEKEPSSSSHNDSLRRAMANNRDLFQPNSELEDLIHSSDD